MSYETLVQSLQVRSDLEGFTARVRGRIEKRVLSVTPSAPPPEGAFGRLFEAIGNFLEELFSGCRAGNIFDNVQLASRKNRWRKRIVRDMVQHTSGEITEEAAEAVVAEAIETSKTEYDELDRIQYRITLAGPPQS
jgi:hypothetical protein